MRQDLDAVILGVVALAMLAGALAFLTATLAPPEARFLVEHVAAFGIVDTAAQRRMFVVFVLALGLLSLASAVLRPMPIAWSNLPGWAWLMVALPLGFYLARNVWRTLRPPASGVEVAVALLYLTLAAALLLHRRLPRWAVPALLCVLLLAALTPALWPGSRVITDAELPWVDQHLGGAFLPAELLARGRALFDANAPDYGVLPAVLLGAWGRVVAPLDLGALVSLTQAGQIAMLLLTLLAARARLRELPDRARWAGLVFVALLAVPFLTTAHPAVLYPNQSGLRFLMLPLAALVAQHFAHGSFVLRSALAGGTAALALLHNPETGIAATAGLGVAWLLVAVRRPDAWHALAAAVAVFIAMPIAVALAYQTVFAAWPWPRGEALSLVSRFAAGFGGLRLAWRPLPVAIALVAAGALAASLRATLRRDARKPDPGSAALATMLLAWFPYWVNRPADWNLWSFIVLAALLLAPWFATASLPRTALALLLLLPIPATHARVAAARLAAAEAHAPCADGLRLAPATCAWLAARGDALAAAPAGTVWATAWPYLALRLADRAPNAEAPDLFSQTRTHAEFAALVDRLRAARTPLLLGDPPDAPALPAPLRAFQERLRDTLGYQDCAPLPGWRVIAPPGACPGS
jgi:hypothetical protein